jgi:uncharacterized membrane protein YgaE (UPF0421/DUF939 family)
MRTIKTVLAVFACLLLYQIWGRDGSFLAAASAIICMQDSMEKSVTSAVSRFFGTVIGAVCAMLILYFEHFLANFNLASPYVILLMMTLGILLIIMLCNLFKQKDTIVISCVVYLVIVLGGSDLNPFLYSANRLLDTTVGIVIAIVINRFICRPTGCEEEETADSDKADEAKTAEAEETKTITQP